MKPKQAVDKEKLIEILAMHKSGFKRWKKDKGTLTDGMDGAIDEVEWLLSVLNSGELDADANQAVEEYKQKIIEFLKNRKYMFDGIADDCKRTGDSREIPYKEKANEVRQIIEIIESGDLD